MSTHNMDGFFHPDSIVVVGASGNPESLGYMVMKNLLLAEFPGPIIPVNPKYESVCGVLSYPAVEDLPRPVELAVICTPPAMIPNLVDQLGEHGTRAAVVLTAGMGAESKPGGPTLQSLMIEAARRHQMRILGPNCLGLLVPGSGINASFAHASPLKGSLAFVSQSGAMSTGVLDWAKSSGIGFSCFISLGNAPDVNFTDALEYLTDDPATSAILLYVESVKNGPGFMKAATQAAKQKPVIAIKSGRVAAAQKAAASHTGALAGSDEVYEAAFRQAGILRVQSIEDLFGAVETLGKAKPLRGDGLAIFSNGGGPGVMATDSLVMNQGRLAKFSEDTLARLNAALPSGWSGANPVDLVGDAPPERYVETLQILLDDPDTAAILFINAPSAIVPSEVIADAMLETIVQADKTVFSCWLGRDGVAAARDRFSEAGIPCFDTPEDAVLAFIDMTRYRKSQWFIAEEPEEQTPVDSLDRERIQKAFQGAIEEGHEMLSEPEAKEVLSAAGLPVVETRIAKDAQECLSLAEEIGYPVVVKIVSAQLSHKSDVGGVVLNIENESQLSAAVESMIQRVNTMRPDAIVEGFSIQEMVRMPSSHELLLGMTRDPIFGPVLMFGHGGTAVEVIRDHAVAIPPLTSSMARELVDRTRISRLLAGYRDRPKAKMDLIYEALLKLSNLVVQFPEIAELDINPLLANDKRVVALDARIRLEAIPH